MQQVKPEKGEKVKTKVRFTSLDVAAMVAELQVLIGLRVSNIYDLNPTTYILKIAKSQQKHQLLIQNGVRFHLTEDKPDKKTIPSGFTMRFRRFLRSKRVESIKQVGVERVVVISFGSDAFSNHLILELYSQGNIILTDQNYRILQCIRSHQFNDKVKTAVGEIYPFQHAANLYIENIDISPEAIDKQLQPQPQPQEQPQLTQPTKKKGKDQNKGGLKIKDLVFKLIPCLFPSVIQHLLTTKGVDPQKKIEGEQGKEKALQGAKACFDFLKGFIGKKQQGYLYSKGEDYFQFSPYSNCKLQKWTCTKQESFGSAVAEYFSKYKHSANEQEQAFEELAWKKYEQIRKDQEQRVKKLVEEQQTYGGKAELIEKNVQEVEAVLKIIATMENNGYSWQAMERMIAQSRKTGDPLANMIHNLNAPKRQITILLSDNQGEEAQLCPLIPVQLLVDYNAYTNATMYYQGRKKQQQKEYRTREASEQVLKLAEKDALKKIQKKKNQLLLKAVPTRKQLWFQKFYWFVTAEGWLVISGRDSHQNELLVKRYMKTGDLYMHSDYGGAASTIIKGPPKAGVAPVGTLQEAAIFTVCRSKAWDTKIISSAWWVYHDQVSKSAPTGQFLPTGSFMIRGKRNFIHPNRMEMGITLLFKLDNQSMARRIELKKSLQAEQDQNQNQTPLVRTESQAIENQEYAIIDLQAQARLAREKKKEKANKAQKDKAQKGKQLIPTQIVKKASVVQQAEDSEEKEEESDEDQQKGTKKDNNKKQIKKADKKNDKKQQPVQPQEVQQKHKNRNKKKLKKLEKYLEEQDQDERQIIMKMLGAKQMKHLKDEEEQDDKQEKKGPNKGGKKDKKRGIDKYINLKSQQQEESINTNKVLFLKEKKNKQSQQDEVPQQQPVQELKQQETNKVKPQQTEEKSQIQAVVQTEEALSAQKIEQVEQQGQKQEEVVDSQEEEIQEKVQEKPQEEEIDEKVIDSELSQLSRLVGRVGGNDKWDGLIPMCAPYQTIKDNRFKVKLVPGGLKKGKAARTILNYYLTTDLDQNQKAFVKALPQQEMINALIGNVKLAGAGLLKLQQKSKADKKQKRKQQDKKTQQ